MCGKIMENPNEGSQNIPIYPELTTDVMSLNPTSTYGGVGQSSIHDVSTFVPWTNPLHFQQINNPARDINDFNCSSLLAGIRPSSSSPSSLFHGYHRLGLQFNFDRPEFLSGIRMYSGSDHLGIGGRGPSSSFGLQADFSKLTAQEIMDAKALAASKNHSEAERRRRGRINGHLDRLRTLLPNTTKTDKASLLAEVIQHVKELKRQTLEIAEVSPLPTENDELTVDADESYADGRTVIRASICCEDRSDLLTDLIKTLKSLRLRALKAEITTLGGRVRNVLLITGEESVEPNEEKLSETVACPSIACVHEALKAVMERQSSSDATAASVKRQRTNLTNLGAI